MVITAIEAVAWFMLAAAIFFVVWFIVRMRPVRLNPFALIAIGLAGEMPLMLSVMTLYLGANKCMSASDASSLFNFLQFACAAFGVWFAFFLEKEHQKCIEESDILWNNAMKRVKTMTPSEEEVDKIYKNIIASCKDAAGMSDTTKNVIRQRAYSTWECNRAREIIRDPKFIRKHLKKSIRVKLLFPHKSRHGR